MRMMLIPDLCDVHGVLSHAPPHQQHPRHPRIRSGQGVVAGGQGRCALCHQ